MLKLSAAKLSRLHASQQKRASLRGRLYAFLTHPWITRLVSLVFANRIPSFSGTVHVPPHSPKEIKASILWGLYEYQERFFISNYLPRNYDTIELGASLGIVTRTILTRLDFDRKLVSVEANHTLREYWLKNTARHSMDFPNVVLDNSLVCYSSTDGFSLGRDNLTGRALPSFSDTSIPKTTLGEISRKFSLRQPFSLVMDVEGMEFDILRHEAPFIRRCAFVCTELHGSKEQNHSFLSDMSQSGFELLAQKHAVAIWQRRAN